jgi:hypothetical protein
MRCPANIWLPVIISGAMALSACSNSSAPGVENNTHSSENRVGALGNGFDNQTGDVAEQGFMDGEFSPFPLCVDAARRRFGFPTNIIINGSNSGEGGPGTYQGEAIIDLNGPPARRFRCALARGAVVSVSEEDASGPATIRN